MHNGRNLVVDSFSEVYTILNPWMTHDFWDFESHEIIPNSIYVVGRKQFVEHKSKVELLLNRPDILLFFDNAAEGSNTLVGQLQALGFDEAAKEKKLLLIGGGDMDADYPCVRYDHFLANILDYDANVAAMNSIEEIFSKKNKPYQCLFLNGRSRPHRKFLFEKLQVEGLIDRTLWSMLDGRPSNSRQLKLTHRGVNLMNTQSPLRPLPAEYEYETYKNSQLDLSNGTRQFVKHQLFNNEWGEIYINPAPYVDTYFSLITETVFEYPYSFRTEKIAKPLAIGHPWIVAASRGYYRDMHNLGFRSFGHVIDESFDLIDDHQDRMDRIYEIVADLLKQNLQSFLDECYNVCKYNQQHLVEIIPQIRQQFPTKFFDLISQYG